MKCHQTNAFLLSMFVGIFKSLWSLMTKPTALQSTITMHGLFFVAPFLGRLLAYNNNHRSMYISSIIKACMSYGLLQDLAVYFQTLLLIEVANWIGGRRSIKRKSNDDVSYKAISIEEKVVVEEENISIIKRLWIAFRQWAHLWILLTGLLWGTLCTLIDLCLQITMHPRMNQSYFVMVLQNMNQFLSSFQSEEAMTRDVKILGVLYLVFYMVTICGLVSQQIFYPKLDRLFCNTSSTQKTSSSSSSLPIAKSSSPEVPVPLVLRVLNGIVSKIIFRYGVLVVFLPVFALESTLSLEEVQRTVQVMSNAMFTLQFESHLQHPPRRQSKAQVFATVDHATGNRTSAPAPEDEENVFLHQLLGPNEVYELIGNKTNGPLWRQTKAFRGEKRFEMNFATNQTEKPNIILINMESWRALDVGVIGAEAKKKKFNKSATPQFDRLSETGILYKNHYTPSVQTSRTILSSLFGILPHYAESSALGQYGSKGLKLKGIPHLMKEEGYDTMFWSAVDLSWENWKGFLQQNAFDKLFGEQQVKATFKEAAEKKPGFKNQVNMKDPNFSWGIHDHISFHGLVYEIIKRKESENKKPFFLDVYSISSHDPYDLPDWYRADLDGLTNQYTEKYLKAMHFSDGSLGKFIDTLRRQGLMENTIVLIEGDHGNGRMEHGNNPGIVQSGVYDEGSHVPLLILADDFIPQDQKGKAVEEITSQTDLLATVMDILMMSSKQNTQKGFTQHSVGHSLLRKDPNRFVVLENPFEGAEKGVRKGELKYIFRTGGSFEVFNLTSDPMEQDAILSGKKAEEMNGHAHVLEALSFVTQAVELTEDMYTSNSFVYERPQLTPNVTENIRRHL